TMQKDMYARAEHLDRSTGPDRTRLTGPDRMYFGPVVGPGFETNSVLDPIGPAKLHGDRNGNADGDGDEYGYRETVTS
nr:hypothetical protein [Tanacetum cinerariifolium]